MADHFWRSEHKQPVHLMIRDKKTLAAAAKQRSLAFHEILEPWKIFRSDRTRLSHWLVEKAAQWNIDQAAKASFDDLTSRQQIAICTNLEKYAIFLADQFQDLNQFSSFSGELFSSYKSVTSAAGDVHRADELVGRKEWNVFRRQLRRDVKLVVDIASQTRATLEKKVKPGQPKKPERDALFIELRDQVSLLKVAKQVSLLKVTNKKQRLEVTKALWNLYFRDAKVMETTTASQFIYRGRKKSKK